MYTRILYGSFSIALVLALVSADALFARVAPAGSVLLSRGSLIPLTVALLAALGALELGKLLAVRGVRIYTGWVVTACVALVLAPWLGAGGVLGDRTEMREMVHLQFLLLGAAMLITGLVGVWRRDVETGLGNIAGSWLTIGYLGLLPSYLVVLRCDIDRPGEHGAWIVVGIILICKACDIGAYFVGTTLGRRKLIPEVSPGKSVEGLLGGVAASIAVGLLAWWVHTTCVPADVSTGVPNATERLRQMAWMASILCEGLGVAQIIILSSLIALIGQAGDLLESVFKRSAGAKDSARIMPGFGGVLDIIDSPIAVAPVAWFLLTTVWGVM
jgi:phosphatidate cytidylyltransferase